MTEVDGAPDPSRSVDRRMALAREWDELVEQVRQLDGFEDFLRPPPLDKLLPAAADGPVAVINVSRWRCDALLVTEDEVRVRDLPGLTAADVQRRVEGYLRQLQRVGQCEAAYVRARRDPAATGEARARAAHELRVARLRAETTLRVVLQWLWDSVAEPVLTELGFAETPAEGAVWPRLWWCPTGLLTLLPLHAAGDHRAPGPDRPTVLDRVVSSYTPTLRALLEARRPLPAGADPPGLLAVTVPDAPGEVPLDNVAAERDMLVARFAGRCTLRDGRDAVVADVLELLPAHRWVHFSCHGDQLLDDPSQGGLRLYDGVLTIGQISERQYSGDFAFLSACKTATGGLALADEAITLAAALHYTGYRHVIGTLWTVYQSEAYTVADAVYADGFEPAKSAHRLHGVLRQMRETERLSAWTPFTHTGP
ncbi:CHAT domain-containing protein [Dactylosporangium sp. CA-233914]|uniref:CHAT domain-containing protein n=1 Tax=Dactylosporangium sp. CA-233914 TaxID=3239934 RepID=UPI003D916328